MYLGAEDAAGPDIYESNVGVSERVLLVTYALLRNSMFSFYAEIRMKYVTGAINGNINSA